MQRPPLTAICRRIALVAFGAMLAGGAATGSAYAGDVTIRLDGLRSGAGQVLVALCQPDTFAKKGCAITGSGPAGQPVTLRDVPPGVYAVQVIHDENGNGELDRGLLLPTEGIGFSRDAPMRRGPPKFADAAVRIPDTGGTLTLTMRYFR